MYLYKGNINVYGHNSSKGNLPKSYIDLTWSAHGFGNYNKSFFCLVMELHGDKYNTNLEVVPPLKCNSMHDVL